SFAGHAGTWKDSAVRQFGWNAANPCWGIWMPGGQKGALPAKSHSFVKIGASNVELSTFKPAEDGDGLIVRLRETAGRAVTTALRLPKTKIRKAMLTNTMEEGGQKLPSTVDSVKVSLPAFGTATIRVLTKK
ncbi:MAG: glycosyl hydrolase-related protein, partial [Planctomycetota bacterium]